MAYETPPHGRPKTRSASICAPASGSLETILNPPSGSGTPDNGTPGYQRRRPATRTQSARITGARSVRFFINKNCTKIKKQRFLFRNYLNINVSELEI